MYTAPTRLLPSSYCPSDGQQEADMKRWELRYIERQEQAQRDFEQRNKERRIKKLFQQEVLAAEHLSHKAVFAPSYHDIKNDEIVYQSYAELLQGELDYEDMSRLLAQLLTEQVKAGNKLAQKILIKASQTFAQSNS